MDKRQSSPGLPSGLRVAPEQECLQFYSLLKQSSRQADEAVPVSIGARCNRMLLVQAIDQQVEALWGVGERAVGGLWGGARGALEGGLAASTRVATAVATAVEGLPAIRQAPDLNRGWMRLVLK